MFEKFTRFFLDNHKITLVVITTISFFGILSYLMLPKQYNPSIVAPAFEIRIPVPGYGSEQASRFVVRELENRLRELPGIDKLYGYSEDEYAAVTVSFKVGTDLEAAKTRLHDKIASNMGTAPYGVRDISIRSIDPEELPQVAFALTYTGTGLSEIDTGVYLRTVANQIKESMKTVDGTSNLEILGGYDNGIHIQPDIKSLETHGLSVSGLGNILRGTIGERVVGVSESGGSRNVISVDGNGNSVDSLKNLPILDVGGVKLLLKDVAEVRRWPIDRKASYSFQKAGESSETTVFLAISKQKWQNAVKVVEGVMAQLEITRKRLPKNVAIETIQNEGETAKEATNELLFHLTLSIGIVFVVLILFLGFRNALNAAFCIPMVLSIVFIVAYIFWIDINRITLFALILSLGILVDDSIVVVENNARHLAERHLTGKSKKEALVASVKEVGISIVLSTVTRILSFLGMFAVTGMMGDYMKPIPVFASIALTASLFVAFSINPFLASLLAKDGKHHDDEKESMIITKYGNLLKRFIGAEAATLKRRKYLKPIFWISLGLIVVTPILLDVFRARMLPKADKDQVYLWIDLPRSATVDETRKITDLAGDYLLNSQEIPEELRIVESVSSSVGDRFLPDFPNLFRGSQDRAKPSQSSMRINLSHAKLRDIPSEEFTIRIRPLLRKKLLETYPDATIRLLEDPPGPPTIATFHVKIKWPTDASTDSLVNFSEAVEWAVRSIATVEKIEDLADTKSRPLSKTKIVLGQERMRERGVSRWDVENVLQGIFSEQTIGILRTDESVLEPEYIIVSLPKSERNETYFKSVTIPSASGKSVPLNEIASFQTDWMRRETYTENRSTTIHLYAEMGSNSVVYPVLRMYGAFENPEFVAKGYEKIGSDPYGVRFFSEKDGREYRVEWGGEWELTMDTFRDMGTAMILSLLAIYFLVVAEFKSFRIGGIIMMTFLFSFFGIFPGFGLLHVLIGTYFTATAMIGAIALGGIVVGNAIILLDYVVQLRASGKSLEESVITGSKKRFVPVLLTSIAAVLGSLIIASDPVWSGLAWSIVFWLSASALLTLFFVPVFFYDLELRRKPKDSPHG